MSGSVGAPRIESRNNYRKIFREYENLLKTFPGFVSVKPSGSYIADVSKESFGDMDLVLVTNGYATKKDAKAALIKWISNKSNFTPFQSDKYKGKLYLNTGELITVGYKCSDESVHFCQIDNNIAITKEEGIFKEEFLNLPADKQGVVIGLVKIAVDFYGLNEVLKRLGCESLHIDPNYRISTNLSGTELTVRGEIYEKDSFKVIKREVLWRSVNWKDVENLLYEFDLDGCFKAILTDINYMMCDKLKERVYGVLGSMVSVKSGEVGTPKGEAKEESLRMAKHILIG